MKCLHIALLSAMPEEIGKTIDHLDKVKIYKYGDLKIYSGIWKNKNKNLLVYLSVAWSGWGKVSAARACTRIISQSFNDKKVDLIVFTGLAGAVSKSINQWDIVIADEVVQHDLDASPLFERFVIPALGKAKLKSAEKWTSLIFNELTKAKENKKLNEFGLLKKGIIATGDVFISDKSKLRSLAKEIDSLDAVEMEGGSVAQVAEQEGLDWILIRVISDNADDSASQEFSKFIKKYENCSFKIIEAFIEAICLNS